MAILLAIIGHRFIEPLIFLDKSKHLYPKYNQIYKVAEYDYLYFIFNFQKV